MKKSFVVLALAAMPLSGFAAQESYTIDPLGFSTMHGRFGKTTGKLTVDREKGTGSVNVKIDASSVNTGFDKRDDHLRSPDFLSVIECPELTYTSTKVTNTPGEAGVVILRGRRWRVRRRLQGPAPPAAARERCRGRGSLLRSENP